MTYLLDANTLIEAKNRYYQMSICPGFWDWLLRYKESGIVASVDSVGYELRKGNDALAEWAKINSTMFLSESEKETQDAFMQIVQHISLLDPTMKAGALDEFLGGADPWIIAKAYVLKATVVTHERQNLANRRKFLIPNVCQYFDVPCMDTFELLNCLEAKFILAV